jgi:hypothetical protein
MTAHGFKDATLDEATIRAWWEKNPDANPAISTGPSKLLVVDNDHGLTSMDEATAWMERNGFPPTYAVRTGRRPEFGLQLYYQSDGSRGCAGWKLNGCSGDIRAEGGYVMAAGSIHPDSGEAYTALLDGTPVAPAPQFVKNLAPEAQTYDPATAVDDATVDEWKTWLLEYAAHNQVNVRDFEKRAPNGAWVGIECPWLHASGPGGESSTVLGILDGKLAFQCSHGTCQAAKRDTAVFKAEMTRRNGEFPAREPGADPEVVISGGRPAPESVTVAEKSTRPIFPDEAWAGTIFGEFADIVCRGNFIRKRLASESFRAITGAIAGDQVTCGIAGVRMREYHVVIANRQSGKSYAMDLAVAFYSKPSLKNLFEPLLMLDGGTNHHRLSGTGAQRFLPGSANSFVDELTREPKHKKGEDVNVILGPKWSPTARLITIQGEAMALFSRMCSPDWTGQALSALVTDLYDSLDAEVAITKDRATPGVPVQLQYSMLLCTQPQIWQRYMAAHMMDSGLFGRFYIVGSEYKPTKVLLPDYSDTELFEQDFGSLRREVFSRLEYLREHPLRMSIAPEAKRRLQEWENALPEDLDMDRDLSSRMGLHVWRAAMARAWGGIPQRTEITIEDAEAAIKLGAYQVKMRQFYAPTPGDSPRWKHLNAVKAAVELAGQISVRDLRRSVRGDRFPEDFEWALKYLEPV